MLPPRLYVLGDKIAGAGNDVQREQLRSILADYDPHVGDDATEAQLRLLLQAVEEVPFSRRVVKVGLSRRIHASGAIAVGVAAGVALAFGSRALVLVAVLVLAAAAGVLALAARRRIRLRSGDKPIDLHGRASIAAAPTAASAVRPLANPPPDLVARARQACSSDPVEGAYVYETVEGEQTRPTIGLHLRTSFPTISGLSRVAERLLPGEDGTAYVELLDRERLAQVRAVATPIAGE